MHSDFDSDRELVFSSPFRLDSSKCIHHYTKYYAYTYIPYLDDAVVGLVAVSPVDIILDIPMKLSIEVKSSGGYFRHAWFKSNEEIFPDGDVLFRETDPEEFSEFFQVFVQYPTSISDQGIYRVDLIDNTSVALQTQEFTVTPLG